MERLKIKHCQQCGVVFHSRHKDAKICSRSCAAKSGKGKTGRKPKHGGCINGKLTPLYIRWAGIIARCLHPSSNKYKEYGGRGIDVCEEWRSSFSAFEKWAKDNGFRPELQIDRIDGTKGYSPENCRWVTPSQNSRNRKDNIKLSDGSILADVAEKVGISRKVLKYRIDKGVPEALALKIPITPNGESRKHFQSYLKKWTDATTPAREPATPQKETL